MAEGVTANEATVPRARIVVAEDDPAILALLCDTLEAHNFQITRCPCGEDALQALSCGRYDVLLTDLSMPGMDGIQLLRTALDLDPDLIGIVMTGQGTIPTAVEAMKLGAREFLMKPVRVSTLLPIIAREMAARRRVTAPGLTKERITDRLIAEPQPEAPSTRTSRVCPQCRTDTSERVCPECRVATVELAPTLDEDLTGQRLDGRYELQSLIGRGGMGAVYRARSLSMGARVAVKVLRRDMLENPEVMQRFFREAQAGSHLNHANAVRVFDFGQSDTGHLYIAMEYLEGRSLHDELDEVGPLPEIRVLRIARQIAIVLGAAHSTGLIHRDVTPGNVFLARMYGIEDFVKLVDFGIARPVTDSRVTKAGMIFGTLGYMSPEQMMGQDLDGRSDLYSLGVLMYQVASGHMPYEAPTAAELLAHQMAGTHAPLADVAPTMLTTGFVRLVEDLLQRDRELRPHSADVVAGRIASMTWHE
jgi:FixJ family two-component response regulator/tRNA A-37 threonylcarbamoyl transferase component Bud32